MSSDGTPLSGQNVTIYHYLNGARYNDTTTATNQSGQIAFITSFNSSGQRTYYAAFAGDSSYQTSTSSVVTVTAVDPTPTPRATQLSLSADNSTPAANQSFTVSGTLTTNGTAVPNEQITLQSASNGSVTLGTPTTTANGSYSLTVSIPTQGNYTLQASFNGDSSYASSNASLPITVGSSQSTAGTSRYTPTKWVGVAIQRAHELLTPDMLAYMEANHWGLWLETTPLWDGAGDYSGNNNVNATVADFKTKLIRS